MSTDRAVGPNLYPNLAQFPYPEWTEGQVDERRQKGHLNS